RVHEGENGGVCSNAYGQRENRDGTEPRALTNRAERVLHILANAVEKLKTPGLSALLFTLIDAAHFAKRSVASFLRRQTRCGVLPRQPLQMIKELFVQLGIQLAALEQRAEPQAKLARPAHGLLNSSRRLDYQRDCGRQAFPFRRFDLQGFAASSGKLVILGAT